MDYCTVFMMVILGWHLWIKPIAMPLTLCAVFTVARCLLTYLTDDSVERVVINSCITMGWSICNLKITDGIWLRLARIVWLMVVYDQVSPFLVTCQHSAESLLYRRTSNSDR